MLFHINSYSLLFILAVGFSHSQRENGKFSNQDGFVFPGEANRPSKFPAQQQNPRNIPIVPDANQGNTPSSFQDFNQCINNCPNQFEYSPICASDNVVYNNLESLNCAQNCGKSIKIVNYGECNGAPVQPQTTELSIQEFNQCVDNCLVTSEYNPVCGTDNVSYSNPGKLGCTRNCGRPVEIANYGPCGGGGGRG